jgi:hypothetical protein
MGGPCPATVYLAYGLRIHSDIVLPELIVDSRPPRVGDLRVRLGRRSSPSDPIDVVFRLDSLTGEPALSCGRTAEGYLIRFTDVADFAVTLDGREIVCCPTTIHDDQGMLRHLLLDLVLPLTAKLRGREALHATAVRTPQGVCAFIGPTGSGKSTVAAGFLKAGYPVISDDCLLLYPHARGIDAVPAYPGLRLWEDTLSALREDKGLSRAVGPHTAKLRWQPRDAIESFSNDAQPLRRIYRLARARDASGTSGIPPSRLEPLTARAAFMELVDATFRLDAIDREMLTREFRFWEKVALTVPMRRLWLEDDLRSPIVRAAVLRDLD